MKPVYMLITDWCPHCKKAKEWMKELVEENPEYAKVEIEIIDEEKTPEKIKEHNFNYYYVPTYYVEGDKVHEGVPTKEIVKSVYEKALGR
ncbi:MAG: thioredoxin family protein [Filifactor alocis]|nr:thioredoxin family protein [Filifactor alocis]